MPAAREFCQPLGAVADAGIGYVTGANDFFHLSPETIRDYRLPKGLLAPTVCRGSAFRGSLFTRADWRKGLASGASAYLLKIDDVKPPRAALKYLRLGEKQGVPLRYKCRTRTPWFRVPNVYRGEAFLTYMSGERPRLVANNAGLFAPNTLHVVRVHDGVPVTGRVLSLLWQTSIARLSAQIEGHAVGGGMLKLEPREAERVLLPDVAGAARFEEFAVEADRLIRNGQEDEARRLADKVTSEQLSRGLAEAVARARPEMRMRFPYAVICALFGFRKMRTPTRRISAGCRPSIAPAGSFRLRADGVRLHDDAGTCGLRSL